MQFSEKNKTNCKEINAKMICEQFDTRNDGNTLQRILTNSHPLMESPTGSDSDSEYEKSIKGPRRNNIFSNAVDAGGGDGGVGNADNTANCGKTGNYQLNYYPDVVPSKEHVYMSIAVDHEITGILNVNHNNDDKNQHNNGLFPATLAIKSTGSTIIGADTTNLTIMTTMSSTSPTTGRSRSSLDNRNNLVPTENRKSAIVYGNNSPDSRVSSVSELNTSQYQTVVNCDFQNVSLTPNHGNVDRESNRINCNDMVMLDGVRCSGNGNGNDNGTITNYNTKNIVHYIQRTIKNDDNKDIKSIDSISNHSFDGDDDIEHNLASLSPSSSLNDGLDNDDDDDENDDNDNDSEDDLVKNDNLSDIDNINNSLIEINITNNIKKIHQRHRQQQRHSIQLVCPDDERNSVLEIKQSTTSSTSKEETNVAAPDDNANIDPSPVFLPQYTANEERRDTRSWQKVVLPDGHSRDIDMRVIEPYKRVLSHGGYLKAGGHNAIVIFCACHLPDRSRTDYNYVMDNLFLYVVKTLEQLVTDDYVLIYLHGGSSRRNMPSFPWLKK